MINKKKTKYTVDLDSTVVDDIRQGALHMKMSQGEYLKKILTEQQQLLADNRSLLDQSNLLKTLIGQQNKIVEQLRSESQLLREIGQQVSKR